MKDASERHISVVGKQKVQPRNFNVRLPLGNIKREGCKTLHNFIEQSMGEGNPKATQKQREIMSKIYLILP